MYTSRHLGVRHDTARSTGAPHLMTRDPVGGRGTGIVEPFRRLDAVTVLLFILVAGFALRVLIAGVFVRESGFAIDVGDFTAWAQRLASVGPGGFYEDGFFADYPPGYLYVLWLLGRDRERPGAGSSGRTSPAGWSRSREASPTSAWPRCCSSWLAAGRATSSTARSPRSARRAFGLVAATLYLFNPGVIFNSAVWGQIDSVGTLLLLLTIYALGRGWTEAAALGAVVAMLVKFQFAFLIPVVLVVGLKRHLFGRSSDPAQAGKPDLLRVVTSAAVGLVSLTLLLLPFNMAIYLPLEGGNPRGILGSSPRRTRPTASSASSSRPRTPTPASRSTRSTSGAIPWSGLGDTLVWGDDRTVAFALGGISLTWQNVGAILFAIVAVWAIVAVARRDDMRGVVLASLVLAIAFFAVPTRVHERYLFPALAIGALLFFAGRAWPWIYAGLSTVFFANIYWVYTEDWSFAGDTIMNPGRLGQPMPQDPFWTATLLTDWGIWGLGLARDGAPPRGPVVHHPSRARAVAGGPGARSGSPAAKTASRSRIRSSRRRAERCRAGWRSTRPMPTCASLHAGSTAATRSSPWVSSSSRSCSASGASTSRGSTTSTRSITRARRWSSSARGTTTGLATCTSGPIRCWRSTSSPPASASSIPTRSPRHRDLEAPASALAVAPRRAWVGHERRSCSVPPARRRSSRPTSRPATRWPAGRPAARWPRSATTPRTWCSSSGSRTPARSRSTSWPGSWRRPMGGHHPRDRRSRQS